MLGNRTKQTEPVFLHLEDEDYQPIFMPKSETSKKFETVCAVPSKNVTRFFISYRGIPKLSKLYAKETLDEPINKMIDLTANISRRMRM
jgi:hypothetical protein